MTGIGEVPGDLGDEVVPRMFGDTEQVGTSAGVLDGEQDIEPLEHQSVDREEVGCQDALGLGSQELGPGRASTRCRS